MIILLPQILLYHVISKSVPITENYSKTIGLLRRNESTIESLRKRKYLKKRKFQEGGSEELKTKQTRIQQLKGWGFGMNRRWGTGLERKKSSSIFIISTTLSFRNSFTHLTGNSEEMMEKLFTNLKMKEEKKIRSMENGPSWHHNA